MFVLIGWIARFLLILFVIRLITSLFTPQQRPQGRPAGGPRPRGPFGGPTPPSERVGGQLVRCAKCGTYVPETKAITVSLGGDVLQFCSDDCRRQYAEAHGS